jgi:fructose-1-phosphate kinase PfkB-like protein
MIFAVILNPSLDRTLSIPELHPGAIHHRFEFFRTP